MALPFAEVPQRFGALAASGLHALAALALLNYEPARSALNAAPLMVELITPLKVQAKPEPAAELAQPKPKPKPKPAAKERPRRLPEPPMAAAPVAAPDSHPAPTAPEPPPPAPVAAAPVAAPADTPPLTAPSTPPVFNADYLDNPAPVYPKLSRRAGEQGRVILRVRVNAEGRAEEVQLRASSGFARLDESARETVSRWKFVPARRGEQAIAAWVLVPVYFKLEG